MTSDQSLIFRPTPLSGLFIVEVQAQRDLRGSFGEIWNTEHFSRHGCPRFMRAAISTNIKKHTLRGMHFQTPPHQDAKLVRVSRGRIFDVALDLRRDSPTFKKWHGVELGVGDLRMILIGEGFAHGYLTLEEETEITYFFSRPYVAEASSGVRWDDPAFGIQWPARPTVISERDAQFGDFSE